MTDTFLETNQRELICQECGAPLRYLPGTHHLKCEACGHENTIPTSSLNLRGLDYTRALAGTLEDFYSEDVARVTCNSCGAETSFALGIVSDDCPFCGSPLVLRTGTMHRSIQPQAILPFTLDRQRGLTAYHEWLTHLWWAPNDLARHATQEGKLIGIYIPYWIYDSSTITYYQGKRGDDIHEEEEYETQENGHRVIRTRTRVRTIWRHVSGTVSRNFNDILVIASNSLPRKNAIRLAPWRLEELVDFNPAYLSGYRTEAYQLDLKQGFEDAQRQMAPVIEHDIHSDIGGDHQLITARETEYQNVRFKHVLLPLWISAYRYKGKVYRFLVNGQTGEVQGARPYSWLKISLAILLLIIIITALTRWVDKSIKVSLDESPSGRNYQCFMA